MAPTDRPPSKSLDRKLARILENPDCGEFVLADAKDADMAFGLAAPGVMPGGDPVRGPFRSLADYRERIREIVRQGLVDVMLMSASTSERLTIEEGLFADSAVTPAVRMNDTTDIWLAAGTGGYAREPALPFATTTIAQARCGRIDCPPTHGLADAVSPAAGGLRGANLGLFSLTLNDDAGLDRAMLEAYRDFRAAAERERFRHFLEVFFPNARRAGAAAQGDHSSTARFLADHVVRALAGVPRAGRPLFLKIPYLGPAVMEQLAAYDRSLVVGILGGSAGTTHDAFGLVADARRHGARVALFGRKINAAEDQLAFVGCLRLVCDGQLDPADAVRKYHDELRKLGLQPRRPLEADLARTPTASAYGG